MIAKPFEYIESVIDPAGGLSAPLGLPFAARCQIDD